VFKNRFVALEHMSSGPATDNFRKGRIAVQSSWSSGAMFSVAGGASATRGLGGTFWPAEVEGHA